MRLSSPVIHNKLQVVHRDTAGHRITESLDHLDRSLGRRVFEHNLELWKRAMDLFELRQEPFLGVHDADILLAVTRYLTVQIQHHPFFLHRLENRIVVLVRLDTRFAVRRHPAWIRLDSRNTGLARLADLVHSQLG